ncbi:MAG TPA: hypothetical protein VF676_10185 [Flavobacterium sp.]|jgi:hypothetical protein
MADILLLDTTLLTVKMDGTIDLPDNGRTNAAAVKAVIDILKYAEPEVLFAGNESQQPEVEAVPDEDCVIAKIHVIDAPSVIDCSRPEDEICKWFLKQLRSSKKHIVLKSTVQNEDHTQTIIDIYVRGIYIPTRDTKVHRLYHHSNRLNYAV